MSDWTIEDVLSYPIEEEACIPPERWAELRAELAELQRKAAALDEIRMAYSHSNDKVQFAGMVEAILREHEGGEG